MRPLRKLRVFEDLLLSSYLEQICVAAALEPTAQFQKTAGGPPDKRDAESAENQTLKKYWRPSVPYARKCRKAISHAEVRRIDFERIECPACGERFDLGAG
jgi:hypothetical protein